MDGNLSSSLTASIFVRKPPVAATLAVSLLSLLSGCGAQPLADAAANSSQSAREAAMRERWTDKPYRELVKDRGRQGLVLDIPRYGWPPSSAVVYGVDSASGCIDAFLVIHGKEPIIKDYFCR